MWSVGDAAGAAARAGGMKILHLATFLQGGAGRVIADLAMAQHEAGHDVSLVVSKTGVPAPGCANNQAYLDDLSGAGIGVEQVDSMFLRDYADNLAVVRAVSQRYAPGHEPAIAHTHAAIPSLVALLYAGVRRVPLAILQTMHGWSASKTPSQVATDVSLMNAVDRVVVPSHHAAEVIASLGVERSRTSVVAHGVRDSAPDLDLRDRSLLRDMERARAAGLLVIACVGTIGARKSQRLLVDAIARMQGPRSVFCAFIGDGETIELQHAIDAAHLAGRVRVHGYSRAARRLVAFADALVLPSRSEGQPLAVLEAFRDGTVVVVSGIPELAELVEDGATGLQFRVDDAPSLASTLDRLARLPDALRHAIADRARLLQASRYTTAMMTNHYFDLYREALTRHLPAAPTPAFTAA
jgi:glycosyltransferase involved in cell wall biosynthesis